MSQRVRGDDRPEGERPFAPPCSLHGRARCVPVHDGEPASPARTAAGWERRFVADRSRADEAVRLYRELGFEVVADPIAPESVRDYCTGCMVLVQHEFRTIYTRKPPPDPASATRAAGAAEKGSPVMRDPIDQLLDEHQAIMAQLELLRRAVADLDARGDAALPDALPALEAASLVMATDLVAHSRREDEALFPALEAVFGAIESPTAVMREEHQAIHGRAELLRRTLHDLNEIEHPAIVAGGERLRALAAGGGGAEDLRTTGAAIMELLDLHFRKEEDILFPMAREVLSPAILREVARSMGEIDVRRG